MARSVRSRRSGPVHHAPEVQSPALQRNDDFNIGSAVTNAALTHDLSPIGGESNRNQAAAEGFLGGPTEDGGGRAEADPRGLFGLEGQLDQPGFAQGLQAGLEAAGLSQTANQAVDQFQAVIAELLANNPALAAQGDGISQQVLEDLAGVQGHLEQLRNDIDGLMGSIEGTEAAADQDADAAQQAAQANNVALDGALGPPPAAEEEAAEEEAAEVEAGVTGEGGVGQLDPAANGAPADDPAAADAAPGGGDPRANGAGMSARIEAIANATNAASNAAAAITAVTNAAGGAGAGAGAGAAMGGGSVSGTRDIQAPRGGGGGRGGSPAGGGSAPSPGRAPAPARAPSPPAAANATPNAASVAVQPDLSKAGEAAEQDASQTQDFQTEATFDYDLPGELANISPPSGAAASLDLSNSPANIGDSVTPQAPTFERPQGEAPAVAAPVGGGVCLTATGVDAAAASSAVAVTQDTGMTAGAASPANAAPRVTPTQSGRNAAAGVAMPAAERPDVGALEFGERGEGGGEQAAGEAGAEAGGSTLADPTVPDVSYAGGGAERLPSVPNAELPDFASAAGTEADGQIQSEAAQLDPVGPQADARIAGEVAPKLTEGTGAVDAATATYEGQVPGFQAESAAVASEATAGVAEAAAQRAADAAAAAARQASESAEFAASEVPAELDRASATAEQATSAAAEHARTATAGEPTIELPGDAVAGMDQAATDLDTFGHDFVAPDLEADFAATQLPDHDLHVEAFDALVDPAGFEFDDGRLPQTSAAGGSGPGLHAEIEGQVMAQLEGAVADQQAAVRDGLSTDGSAGLEALQEQARATYDEGAAFAEQAVADWDAVDISAEVAGFDAEAAAAAERATSENTATAATLSTDFNAAQGEFESLCEAGNAEFTGELTSATGDHQRTLGDASNTYNTDIGSANEALRTGHDAALGEYVGTAQGAIQGAQNSFDAENQLTQTALDGHQNQISTEMADLQAQAAECTAQASAQYEAEFQAQQQHAQSERDRLMSEADAEVQGLQTEGNAEVQAALNQGQTDAQAEIQGAVDNANRDVAQANAEADQKLAEAEKEPSLLERATNWLRDQINKALDWIKSKFDQVKNAINSALDAARNAALGILEAAKNAALGILDSVRSAIQQAISRVAGAINAMIEVVSSALQAAVQAVTDFVNQAIQTITDSINGALEAFRGAVNGLIDGFVNVVSLINEDLGATLDQATQGFQDTFNGLVDGAQAQVTAAGDAMQAAVDAAGQQLQDRIESAENALQDKVTAAEETLNAAVDAAYDVAVQAVEQTFETLEDAVNTTFDAAKAAVNEALDAAYGAIETGIRAMEQVVVTGLEKLDEGLQWVNENIVQPFTEFLADAWEGLQRFWVDFWNSQFRDILLGVALTALAIGITVATGGAGAPLAVVILATAAGTGAAAAGAYGLGELGAREANQNLTTNLDTVDLSPDEIRNLSPDQVAAMAEEANVTWPGRTHIDPATGQLLPDFTDPKNSWYADTMGDFTSNRDGSFSYRDDSGQLITLSAEDMANMSPEMRESLTSQIYAQDEDGNFTGESLLDSVRGAGAIAAEKGIEHAISGAVTAATMGTMPGAGLGVGGLATTGKVGAMQFARAQAVTSGINAVTSVGSEVLSGTVAEMIEDDRSFGDAFDVGHKYDDLGDVAIGVGTNFAADFTTGMLGGARNNLTHGTFRGGTSSVPAWQGRVLETGGNVVNNGINAGFSTLGDNLIDDDKAWNDGLADAIFTTDHVTSAVGQTAGSMVTDGVSGRVSDGRDLSRGQSAALKASTETLGDVTGNVVTTGLDVGIHDGVSNIPQALVDSDYFDGHERWDGRTAALSGEGLAGSTGKGVSAAIKNDIQRNGAFGSDGYNTRGMSSAELTARGAANYDAVRHNVVGQPPGQEAPEGYHFRRNSDGEIIAVVRNRADDSRHAPLTIDSQGNIAFGTSRNNSTDHPGLTPAERRAIRLQEQAEEAARSNAGPPPAS